MNKNEYRLVIDINDEVGGGNGAIAKDKTSSAQTQDFSKSIKNLVKYQVAQPFINTTKQIIMNSVETNTGSGELTQRIQLGTSIVQGAGNTIVAGANLGAVLGVGAGMGIAVAGMLAIFKTGLDILAKQVEIQNKTKLENEQLSILRGRAGIQFNRSRGGE